MPSLLALCALLAAGCGPSEERLENGDVVSAGDEFQIVSVTAESLKREVAEIDAEIVVLNVWATWCGPCRSEFPEFVRYGREMADGGVAVRFLSVDEAHMLPQVNQFLTERGIAGRTYLTSEGTDIVGAVAAPQPWSYGIPVTFLFDGDGVLRDYWEGAVTYDFLQAKVKRVREAS